MSMIVPGSPAVRAAQMAPASEPGAGGALSVSPSLVEGQPSATITVTTNATSQTASVTIANVLVSVATGFSATETATAIGGAIAGNSTLNGFLNVGESSNVVTVQANGSGAAYMYPIAASGTGALVLTVSGSELDFPNNLVVPLQTRAVAIPGSAGTLSLYAGVPITVDPATKSYLRTNGFIA